MFVAASTITAGETAAIIASVALAILAVGLLFAISSLLRTLRQLRASLEQFNREAVPLVGDLRSTVGQANAELVRVDGLLGTAENISGTLDSASRLAYLFFANPVVKAMAFGAGTARAARRLRRAPK
jgi:O-antigen ligase